VLTTDVDGSSRLDVPLDAPVDLEGVQVYYRPINFPRKIYYSRDFARLADSLLPECDVVHVNGMFLWPGPHLSRIARRQSKTLVISPRGMLNPEMIAGKSRLLKKIWIHLQEKSNLASAHAIHVTSNIEAEGLQLMGLDLAPIKVIGNGVEVPRRLPSQSEVDAIWGDIPHGCRVAFLARLDWTKGLDLAIEAVRRQSEAMLLIAGYDQAGLRAKLETRLRRPNGATCGAFLGPLNEQAKWAFLQGADVLLAPSVSESFGMSVAEALTVGTPAIVTPGVGAGTILQQIDQTLITQRDVDSLAGALSSLLADEVRRSTIGEAAQTIMKTDYSWSRIAAAISELYGSSPQI
jgi:glycosyltransferase involved in cell wall biosynthesis